VWDRGRGKGTYAESGCREPMGMGIGSEFGRGRGQRSGVNTTLPAWILVWRTITRGGDGGGGPTLVTGRRHAATRKKGVAHFVERENLVGRMIGELVRLFPYDVELMWVIFAGWCDDMNGLHWIHEHLPTTRVVRRMGGS